MRITKWANSYLSQLNPLGSVRLICIGGAVSAEPGNYEEGKDYFISCPTYSLVTSKRSYLKLKNKTIDYYPDSIGLALRVY